jgi:hypothetical protein
MEPIFDGLFFISKLFYCAQRGCITDVGGFEVGQARNVKPHIDLKMKLHKKLNKDCPAQTNAEE